MKMKIVNSLETLNELVAKVKAAQLKFAAYTQEQIDYIFKAVALELSKHKIPLARMAVEETGMGLLEDKVIKNQFSAEYIYNKYKNTKTCGIIERDVAHGLTKVAEPVGVIAGVVPTTNPTSTVIFKSLLALKTRNGIIFSPHPRAKNCTATTLKLIYETAIANGAPEDIIGWIDEPTIELSQGLMNHPDIAVILATGGPAMVKAAYSSGNPAIGVGPGNPPAIIDETADLPMAVASIILSKTFDNGMICASEQSAIIVKAVYDKVKKLFTESNCHFLTPEEKQKVGAVIMPEGRLNPAIVGQSAFTIAKMAGVKVAETTKVLLAEVDKIGDEEPFSKEKLSPVLAIYVAKDYDDAIAKAERLLRLGGPGHTAILYTKEGNEERIQHFANVLPACRLLINSPSSYGGIGDIYNFRLEPSLTLGCGSYGKNSVSENIGVKHLLNIKTVAERRENMLWFKVPEKIYFKRGSTKFALEELKGHKKALIITDKPLFDLGYAKKVTEVFDAINIQYTVFFEVLPEPTISMVYKIVDLANNFQPDIIVALGGGSPIDAAKVVQLLYEHPEMKFEDIAARFMDIRKRIFELPALGSKAKLICIPTTSGTGSETTPFALITDDATHTKHSLADYAFTPYMAIIDPEFVLSMPRGLATAAGVDILVHALEAYVSVMATPFSDGMALQALKLLFNHLEKSIKESNFEDREAVHYAATLAGMAFSNAFLGICHSLGHKFGAKFGVPHGFTVCYHICQVIRFNSSTKPTKQTAFPQYRVPNALERYGEISDFLGFGGSTPKEKVDNLIKAITNLKTSLGIPLSLKDTGITEEAFKEAMKDLPELAYDDQCTAANPRYPLISEMEQLYWKAYYGEIDFEL